MQTAALNYKLIKKIKDERFDEESLHLYQLFINIGTRDLQVLVIQENIVLLLEDYVFPSLNTNQELLHVLEQLFDAHACLRAGFWKSITVGIKNNKYVQVPQTLFVAESAAEYLKFNAHVSTGHEDFLFNENSRSGAITVFAVNKDLHAWINTIYTNKPPLFVHQSSALIEGVMEASETSTDHSLYIYIDRFKLHIISCKKGKLFYYNQFIVKQFSDYVKYIMLVMKTLNMDQQTSRVVLWGYIGKNSPHYHEFYKYISNVTFGERPAYLSFGYIFDEVQDHHFFDLYSISLIQS
ncbi:MAG: DUF3822 family protein [Cyclobacteriaceae bacterium]|nr:DUF3822 family protein [Cyclobacteriaceae bacterium]